MSQDASAKNGLPFRPAAAEGEPDPSALKAELIARGVKYLLPSYVDMHGASKAKMVPIDHFDQMMGGSELFTGAALDGVPQDVSDEEVASHPDPASCLILPWQRGYRLVRLQPSLRWASRSSRAAETSSAASRDQGAAAMGYGMNLGVETEFFVFRRDRRRRVHRRSAASNNLGKSAYDVSRLIDNMHWIGRARRGDERARLGRLFLRPRRRDRPVRNRFRLRRRANDRRSVRLLPPVGRRDRSGSTAISRSFMPKPMTNYSGNGAHFNMVALRHRDGGCERRSSDPADPRGNKMASIGYQFIAGLLETSAGDHRGQLRPA